MSSLKFSLLGPPRLERDGVTLEFDTRKIIALAAYLAVTGQPHTRESLITLLWPGLEPSRARAVLRRNLSLLRRALHGEWPVVEGETIGPDPDADLWIDVDQFRQRVAACEDHGHPPTEACPDCVPLLEEAAALYRDHFLAGFTLRDSAAFDEFQFFETEGLKDELAGALVRLTSYYISQGDFEAAIAHARRWLALDPLNEQAHRHLMVLYAQAGRRTAALRQYRACTRVLEEELGLAPSAETTALYERIQAERARPGEGVLAELMQAPQVRAAVVAFRTDFEAACEQIYVLGTYKQLHDLLHTLQFHCYSLILQEARRFPDDDVALENLMDYELTLQRIIDDLRNTAERASFPATETVWIGELVKAREALREAIEGLDSQSLKRAIWLLNRVLAVQPSRINTRLNTTARALRLPALVEAMARVSDNLDQLDLDPEQVDQFEAGVDALAGLGHSLIDLVDDHDKWQVVDLELRRIEGSMGQDTLELEMTWPELQAMTEPLYGGAAGEWAVSFRQDGQHLHSAIAAENPALIKRYFRRYRRRASIRFHQVDVGLKRVCEDLRQVGEPLASVMGMIA